MIEKEAKSISEIEQNTLTVGKSKVRYVTQGHGKPIMVIMGPGTILMNFFSDAFKSKVTLVAIDQWWTQEKDSKSEDNDVKTMSHEQFINDTCEVINALRQVYPNRPFGLLGMSILSLVALECALKSNDLDFVMLAGVPFFKLSYGFPESIEYHDTHAGTRSVALRENLIAQFEQISGKKPDFEKLILPHSNLNKDGSLTPNSFLVEYFRTLAPLQVFDVPRYDTIVENFRMGITGLVINQAFYGHFFEKIVSNLEQAKTLLPQLLEKGLGACLVSGGSDTTTPMRHEDKQWLEQLNAQYGQCKHIHYKNCGHYPMTESTTREEFDHDIEDILRQICRAIPQYTSKQVPSIFKTSAKSDVQQDKLIMDSPESSQLEQRSQVTESQMNP